MKNLEHYQALYDGGMSLNAICKQDPTAKRLFLQHNLKFRTKSHAMKLVPKEPWSKERRDKHSDVMLTVVRTHPESYNYNNICRRVKRSELNGEYFHSEWELIVAEFLSEMNIEWTRKVKSFDYHFNGKTHQYFPDFYLPNFYTYIEVKGYKTDRDDAKWKDFPEKLIIILEADIRKIRNRKWECGEIGITPDS